MKSKQKTSAKELAVRLHQAAAMGQLDTVRKLLAKGAAPDRRPTGESTPLIIAASTGHLPVVKELLAAGANPSFSHGGKEGTTALREAIQHRRFDVARNLIAAGADVHFDWSGEGQNIANETVRLCNKLFASPDESADTQVEACLAVMRDILAAGGRTKPGTFRSAAAYGNVGLMRLLLEFGTKVNELDGGNTALRASVLFRQEDIAVELLRLGADPWLDEALFTCAPVLHEAVVKGVAKVVSAIIETRADLDGRGDVVIGDAPPETLVEESAIGGVVAREWKFHPPPMARNATALIVAVRIGSLEMAGLLTTGGADLEATDGDGFTALAWALKLDHQEIADLLRHAGAKEPSHLEGSPLKALVSASKVGDIEKVRKALAAGADVDSVYDAGCERYTALMRAAATGHLHVVDKLLKAGANPDQGGVDATFTSGITPLMLAARAGHAPIVKRLLEAGARPELRQINLLGLVLGPKRERSRPLDAAIHEAAAVGHTEIVQLLLDAGAKVSDHSGASGNVMEAAAASGQKETLETVLGTTTGRKRRSRPSIQALIGAVESRNEDSVRTLIESGADVNAYTRRGDTALASAAAIGYAGMVRLLLEAGAKLTQDELPLAAGGGFADVVRLLLDAGAEVNAQGADGDTALHLAVTIAHVKLLEMLLAAGASIAIQNEEGRTPLQTAKQIVSVWRDREHPIVGGLTNLDAYERCVTILERVEQSK